VSGKAVEAAHRPRSELRDVPVEIGEREIHQRDVAPNPFDLLQIPDGEGVVVAEPEQHTVGLDRLQLVVREVPRHERIGAASRGRAEVQAAGKQRDQRGHGHLPARGDGS
jgi:hypothetical protein